MTESVVITRPNIVTGRPYTRRVWIVRDWTEYLGIEIGRPVIVTNAPGHPYEIHEVLSPSEAASVEIECPPCRGTGETPVPGTYGPTVSPENLELIPCALCQGSGTVTQALLDDHDTHIASIEF